MLTLLKPGDVFVDVGANIGYFSVLAASVVGPTGAVFAFEPDPENYRLLKANVTLNDMADCVSPVQSALSDVSGDGRLYLSADNLGDHQLFVGDESRESVSVAMLRGCEYLAEKTSRIDLVKIDVQGSEHHALVGLMPLLSVVDPAPTLIIELTPHALQQAGASGRALLQMLDTLDQPMWIIDHLQGRLYATNAQELAQWCDNWSVVSESRGFINILVGAAP